MIMNKGCFLVFICYGIVKSRKKIFNKIVREDGVYVIYFKKILIIKMLVLFILKVILLVL